MKHSLLLLLALVLQSFTAWALNIPGNSTWDSLSTHCNGYLVDINTRKHITVWKQTGDKFIRISSLKTDSIPKYDFIRGATAVQGNRIWMLGGLETNDAGKGTKSATVLTVTITPEGQVAGLKSVRPLPFPCTLGRALVHNQKLWFLGGVGNFIAADILADGELGEWKEYCSYPQAVRAGGFTVYKGCFYANGKHTPNWRGQDKMFAIKLTDVEKPKAWVQVESPKNALGRLYVHQDALYYFDEISGNIYKTTQKDDGIQLNPWQTSMQMPCPPMTWGVNMAPANGGFYIWGGSIRAENRHQGFFKGAFIPAADLK